MATPTRAEIQTEWANAVKLVHDTWLYGRVNATNLISNLDTFEQALEGDWLDDATAAAQTIRASVNGVINPATVLPLARITRNRAASTPLNPGSAE